MTWHLIDTRTGRPASLAAYPSREQAEAAALGEILPKGAGAHDVHELMPWLDIVDTDEPRASSPASREMTSAFRHQRAS